MGKRSHLDELDIAKGIGIFLVVFGHLVASSSGGAEWYADLKRLIYQFHMPFFIFLSGIAFAYVRPRYPDLSLGKYVNGRALRLLVPFVAFGVLIIGAKLMAQMIFVVDSVPDSFWSGLKHLAIETEKSPARSIWYMFVLFAYCVLVFPIGLLTRQKLIILSVIGAVIHFIELPDILYLNRIGFFFAFFVIGLWAGQYYEAFLSFLRRYGLVFFIVFIAVCIALLIYNRTVFGTKTIGGLAALGGVYYLSLMLVGRERGWIVTLGRYSFPIYLFNTLVIGGTKAVFLAAGFTLQAHFNLFIVISLIAGLFIPIAIYMVMNRLTPGIAKYLK